jgi:hypothetical protein
VAVHGLGRTNGWQCRHAAQAQVELRPWHGSVRAEDGRCKQDMTRAKNARGSGVRGSDAARPKQARDQQQEKEEELCRTTTSNCAACRTTVCREVTRGGRGGEYGAARSEREAAQRHEAVGGAESGVGGG